MKVQVISRDVGSALLVSALFMFLSILVSFANGNDSALAALLISFTITFTVGIFPFIFVRDNSAITTREGYCVIVLSWLLSFIFGMLPYALWGGPFTIVNAWFESVSGFTTTGATILDDVEALPKSLLFWRSSTHFIGGLGIVVFLLLVIPNSSQMKLRLTNMELSSLSRYEYQARTNKTVGIFTRVYFGIMAASFVCYLLAGMDPFDAVNHAMSVTATGGFSTRNLSIGAYDSVTIDLITMFFMVLSSVHFGIIYMTIAFKTLKPLKNEVFKYFMMMLALAAIIVTVSLKVNGIEQTWGRSLLSGSFHVISYATTTGFGIADNSGWPMLPSALLLFVGIWCGMAGSTSGGVKIDRAVLLCKEIKFRLQNVMHPTSIHEVRVDRRVIRQEDLAPHILYISLFLLIFLFSVVVNLMIQPDAAHAFYGTLTSLSNVGPAIGDLGTYASFSAEPAGAKLLYTLDMFLGRVEIYPVLAVLAMVFSRGDK
ncbi:MAG: TrkH family potassium uptake protein [Bacteroidales bacterium]|nr:TrkH family potassium uptake protein [Bacteroidales bacterium]